ncbi:nucleoside-diphosphate sugar epimerase [Rhizobium sp. Root708]|uniref:NAD-dependent epimerase/dehydratase family protein n=1 Tax=Rhizobium sp. Root708 TaxID=1736592 RepID=UPI0006F5210A|nr:NAD(P)-dependent oxidoreductase [Rhizobium sp. Root708]KRB49287.1 nucleoside-diphosphate sugar epimerase [Rhizobium sp. Root708]
MPDALVLVTGATGRIGKVVVADLLDRGYRVRATTRQAAAEDCREGIEWRVVNFASLCDYPLLVEGCDAIIHLAAELGDKYRMLQVNVGATRLLAKAAEKAGIGAFCYASSVSVYGSGRTVEIDEGSAVLTHDRDDRSEYWALPYVREYGRTKLCGEMGLRDAAWQTRYIILRPTVVVSVAEIIGIRDWSPVKRLLAAHRHAHHIYVGDVSDALIWFMQRALDGAYKPGEVAVYNLAEDDCATRRHIDFMRRAYPVSRDSRYRPLEVHWFADWMHDFLRFHTLPLRNPLWRMRFANDRLKASGYRFRYGMEKAVDQAIAQLRKESQENRGGSRHPL